MYHFPSQWPLSRSAEIKTGSRGNVAAEIASIATRQKPQNELRIEIRPVETVEATIAPGFHGSISRISVLTRIING